jgi:2-oxoglutarate ferredoxin oxidoreductase subunit alpha
MSERVVKKGNEALCEAALRAGCKFFAGYPITPQTTATEYLSWRMKEVGGVFVQAECELAAINMVVGSAFSGTRSMTATSGPGLSLMTETLSVIAGTRLPTVIVDIQRAGAGIGGRELPLPVHRAPDEDGDADHSVKSPSAGRLGG